MSTENQTHYPFFPYQKVYTVYHLMACALRVDPNDRRPDLEENDPALIELQRMVKQVEDLLKQMHADNLGQVQEKFDDLEKRNDNLSDWLVDSRRATNNAHHRISQLLDVQSFASMIEEEGMAETLFNGLSSENKSRVLAAGLRHLKDAQ